MKNVLSLLSVLAMCAMMLSCSDEQTDSAKKQKVQFAFSVPSTLSSGGRTLSELPTGSKIQVTLATPSGTAVLTNQTINILSFGDSYISEPIELPTGTFVVTDFLIVNNSQVIYATPKTGSVKAPLVASPLPVNFIVGNGQLTNIALDVLDVTQSTPGAFGYVSFGVNVVNPLPIAVFRKSGDGLKLTNAILHIYDGDDELESIALDPKVNYVDFNYSKDKVYRIKVTKEGYIDHANEFSYYAVNPYGVSDGPLNIILEPTSTPSLTYFDNGDYTNVKFREAAQLKIYRSEYFETLNFAANSSNWLWHYYQFSSNRDVVITGDLDKIISFTQFNSYSLDVTKLVNLEEFVIEQAHWNAPLDLTHSTKLKTLNLLGAKQLLLPTSHNINTIVLTDDTWYFSDILSNVYNNAVAKNITNGSVTLNYRTPDSMNPDELSLLNSLHTLGWTITYNPD